MGIDRTEGWSESYEQIASELEPELGVWNQRYRELDSWATENTRTGGLKQFDGISTIFSMPAAGSAY